MSSADSVMDILSRVNIDKFPDDERIAVATVQVEALDEWLAANLANFTASSASMAGTADSLEGG